MLNAFKKCLVAGSALLLLSTYVFPAVSQDELTKEAEHCKAGRQTEKQAAEPVQAVAPADISSVLENALAESSAQALALLGQQGGYLYPPKNKIVLDDIVISFGKFPLKKEIEQSLSDFLKKEIDEKIANFKISDKYVCIRHPAVDCSIDQDSVVMKLSYSIISRKGIMPVESEISLPIRLGYVLNVARKFSKNDSNDSIGKLNCLNVTISVQKDGKKIYIIEDEKSQIEGYNYFFMFATEPKRSHQSLKLVPFDQYTVNIGEKLIIPINAVDSEGNKISYSCTSDSLQINKDAGNIEFFADNGGYYKFVLTATDSRGNLGQQLLEIKVTDFQTDEPTNQ